MIHYILKKITAKRLEKNFSQRYMASRLGISQSYYNKLENGKIEVSMKMILDILLVLEIDTPELFGDSTRNKANLMRQYNSANSSNDI